MSGLFLGERESGTHSTSRDKASDAAAGILTLLNLIQLLSGGHGTSWCSSAAHCIYSGRTARAKKAQLPFFLSWNASWQIWESHARSASTTAQSTRTICSWTSALRRELTAPFTPQQNRPVESAISRAFKAGHAERHGTPQLYSDIRLVEVRCNTDAAGTSLCLESLFWASECFNRAVISVNDERLPPQPWEFLQEPPAVATAALASARL